MKKIFLFVLILFCLAINFPAQTKVAETGSDCLRDHETVWDFFMAQRIAPMIRIITVDRETNLLYYRFEEKKQIMLGSLKLVKEGHYEKNFYADSEGYYRIIFCFKHMVVWIIEKIERKKSHSSNSVLIPRPFDISLFVMPLAVNSAQDIFPPRFPSGSLQKFPKISK